MGGEAQLKNGFREVCWTWDDRLLESAPGEMTLIRLSASVLDFLPPVRSATDTVQRAGWLASPPDIVERGAWLYGKMASAGLLPGTSRIGDPDRA